jgi:hypothetical protein
MIKQSIEMKWKEHSLDLDSIEAWMRSNVPSYVGNAANAAKLDLFFSEKLSEADLALVESKLAELESPEHEWALAYRSREQRAQDKALREERIKQMKLGMLEKTWANMSGTERKLYLGLDAEVLDSELAAALEG